MLFFINAHSQENNYWYNQVGVRGTLLSGAVTAGVRDNSATYYNPGALGFLKSSSISLSTNSIISPLLISIR